MRKLEFETDAFAFADKVRARVQRVPPDSVRGRPGAASSHTVAHPSSCATGRALYHALPAVRTLTQRSTPAAAGGGELVPGRCQEGQGCAAGGDLRQGGCHLRR